MDHSPGNKVHIRVSQPADNEGLVALSSLAAMQGEIAFRAERYPNFFRLPAVRGNSTTLVAETDAQLIVGSATFTQMLVYLEDIETTVCYLSDFKVHPDFRRQGITLLLIELLLEKMHARQADLVFSTSLAGNKAIEKFYAGNAQWPAASFAGEFQVYQMIPGFYPSRSRKYELKKVEPNTENLNFLNSFMQNHALAPVFSLQSMADSTLLSAYHGKECVATLCLCDAGYMKQETLTGLPASLKLLTKVMYAIRKYLPVVNLPVLNEEMKILYIRAFACVPGHEKALSLLIRKALTLAHREAYHFVTVGIHEKNPRKKLFANHLHFTVHSRLYTGSLQNKQSTILPVLQGIPFLDYSRV